MFLYKSYEFPSFSPIRIEVTPVDQEVDGRLCKQIKSIKIIIMQRNCYFCTDQIDACIKY